MFYICFFFQAMVVYADPPDACGRLSPPPNLTDYTGKWAVLIKRYNCTFDEKVRTAQNANYQVAIVHNVNSTDLGLYLIYVRYVITVW